jgi:excisionase family DNA binding protein
MQRSADSGEEYLNAREAARYLAVSPTTLYRLINSGTLLTFRSEVNKRDRLVRRADLDRLKSPQPVGGER